MMAGGNREETKKIIEKTIRLLYAKVAFSKSVKRRNISVPYLAAEDGQFLGTLSRKKNDPNSIFNKYGVYGSAYSNISIFNKYGTYGSEDSMYSPFNKLTTTPPKIIYRGRRIGFLTKNDKINGQIDPDKLFEALLKKKRINWRSFWKQFVHDG